MLVHEEAVKMLKPGLEAILKTFLKLMDDIDFDELVEALQNLVEIFEEDIAPYATGLCIKLGEAYMRLVNSKG